MLAKFLRVGAVLVTMLLGAGAVQAQIVVPMQPPPAMPYEAVPVPPPGAPGLWVWRPGRWRWNGHAYLWVAGRYVHPPRPHAAWVPGHWAARRGHWVWVPGHWR